MTAWSTELGCDVLSLTQAVERIGKSNDYYVYILWKTYHTEPVPFYVGKGHLQRLIKHGMLSEAKANVYKARIIQKHAQHGIQCGYSIINFFSDEDSALQAEVDLIALIGRYDLKRGPLANRTDGGDGTRGHLAHKRGMSASARAVVADGASYACLTDAASALAVTSGAVSGRIQNGWEGYFYEDEGQRVATKVIVGRYRKAVFVGGQRFDSASDASKAIGLDVRQISKRILYGWDGYYYENQGQLKRRTVWGSRSDKVGVMVRGVSFETAAAASVATGESQVMISKRALSSNYPDYVRKDGRLDKKASPPRSPHRVAVGGRVYDSISAAAQEHGLTDGGVAYRCASGGYPDWGYADDKRQSLKAFVPRFSSQPVRVKVGGTLYSSQSEAAVALNIDINTLKKRCISLSFPSYTCEGITKAAPRDGRPGLIGVVIDGITFRSISDASRALRVSRSVVAERLRSDAWPEYCFAV